MLYIAYAVLWLLRFALGACVFSFLGVVVWRLPRRESVVKGRSHCPVCERTLSAAELIPCLSFLLQGGKCRGCGAKIPARDFWIEVLGGLCSCACAYAFGGESAQAALAFVVLGILTVVALMDIDTLEIYDRFPALLFVCGIAAHILIPSLGIKSRLIGCVIVSVPMLLLALIVPGGFGGGDIKLMFGAGFFLGAKLTVVAAFIGILLGGGFGALRSPKRRQTGKASSHSVRFCASALRSPCFSEKRLRTGIWDYCNEWRGGSAWLHPTTAG